MREYDTSEFIARLIASLPKLSTSKKKLSVDEAEALVADDDELFDAVAVYTGANIDVFHDYPDQLAKLIAIMKRMKPFTPWFGTFYRGQQFNCDPSPLGFRSWSVNRSTALYFADGRYGMICEMTGPVRGVSIQGIALWRMRMRAGESHYCGMQAEWLLLDSA